MTRKVLFSIMFFLLFAILYVPLSYSQTFQLLVSNDHWDGHKVYTIDLTVTNTSANAIEFATATIALTVNNSALNGGTITKTGCVVPGSSQLVAAQIPSTASQNFSATSGSGSSQVRILKLNFPTPPSPGSGTMFNTGVGVRMFTLQLTNSVDWVIVDPNTLDFCPQATYPSNFNIEVYDIDGNATNTDIWGNQTLLKSLSGPLLPVELSSFVSNVNGRQVNLNWETKTEVNFNRFEIDRALVNTKDAAVTWATVGNVQASGTSNSSKKYSYTDKNLQSGKYQYRLKMIDNDGSFKYSSVEATEVAIPKDFSLSQNYPNPFNPSTKIDYQVPVDAKVIMEVYNITGQKVIDLVNQEQSAGYYTVDFGASKLASGVYIYRLAAVDKATGNNFSSIKKMMLLK